MSSHLKKFGTLEVEEDSSEDEAEAMKITDPLSKLTETG